MPLQEFSKIVILKDTQTARDAFGPPINETDIVTAALGNRNSTNPFYTRLVGQNVFFRGGWRENYPNIDVTLDPGIPPTSGPGNDGSGTNQWVDAVRGNFLQAMTNLEEGTTNGYNKLPQSAGTAIIYQNKLYFGGTTPSGWTYNETTTFSIPSPALAAGDFIFWGDDPNSLNIGGKIKTVIPAGADFDLGARYEFEQATEVSTGSSSTVGVPVNIYYYRSSWNGKGIKNIEQNNPNQEIGGGFYVLIRLLGDNNGIFLPYLGFDQARVGDANAAAKNNSNERIISDNFYAFTDLIRIRRISNKWKSDETENDTIGEEIIPCTIHRTSNFYYAYTNTQTTTADWDGPGGFLTSVHEKTNIGGFSRWAAYYVNPYGGTNGKLDKNTTYVLEVNERLPAAGPLNGQALFNFGYNGSI